MRKVEKKQVCRCENCGNEAEMVVTCSLEDHEPEASEAPPASQGRKVKGTATCTHCGNEADMWVDL
jgi:hypothetical protein